MNRILNFLANFPASYWVVLWVLGLLAMVFERKPDRWVYDAEDGGSD